MEEAEVELLKVLLVVILLFCCVIPGGSTPLGVDTLLLGKALLLSVEDATIDGEVVLSPIAVVSNGLEAVAISGVDDAEKSSPGWDALNWPLGALSGLPFCLEAFLCKVVLKCLLRWPELVNHLSQASHWYVLSLLTSIPPPLTLPSLPTLLTDPGAPRFP